MKKSYLLIMLFSLLLSNCSKKEEVANVPYIISKEEKVYDERFKEGKFVPPPPPKGPFVYGSNIFIIDKDTTVFYFQQPRYFICGTDSAENRPPLFFGFAKEDFIELPSSSIKDFILLNFKPGERNYFNVASQIDTLNFPVYYDLINTIKQCNLQRDGDMFIIRKTTQEEDTVIEYKKRRKEYFYKNIKWDTTRIDTITYKFLKRPK